MIAAGPRRWSPRGRRVVAVVVAAVLLVGVAVWYADTRRRDHEFALLLGCATSAENARVAAERRVAAMASYVRPSLAVFSEPDRQLYPLIAHEAVAAQPDLQAAVRRCDDVQVWRLHSDLTAARASYLVYLGTETSRLGAIAADGSHAYDDTDDITALRTRAFAALSAAATGAVARREVTALARVDQ